ncbi:MAG: DUF1697 domain-containing protein [Acidobacteriota bacterium]|nr:DUF1697 domain-containing protein [Acidobacteriota bacterium]MDE3139055.1 DUF1697 domain-containing protein [Acidobacteriota bacterium]MDE3146907.1 DUF1697 domain-containing protein [Acidobacteriota bacterium]
MSITRSVALLRGVNVGARNRLSMTDLARWLGDAGFTGVRTYIQSGNVVLEHPVHQDVGAIVHQVIAERARLDVGVVVCSSRELIDVVARNPYVGVEPTRLHVSFLDAAPDPAALLKARQRDWSPEEFTVEDRVVYLHLPHGMGRSVMVPRLAMLRRATTRNWNTVAALCELAAEFRTP